MAKKIKVLTDKYKSTTKIYPKIKKECLPSDVLNDLDDITKVVANPTLAGTESELTGIEVGDTKYKIPEGTVVIANPTLAGTEDNLEGLQVGDTKYKIPENQPRNIYSTTAEPYLVDSELAYYVPSLLNVKTGDFVLNKDSSNNFKVLYRVTSVVEDNAFVTNVGYFNKQLYQHNIKAYKYQKWTFTLTLITNSNTSFTIETLFNWLADNGYNTSEKILSCSGVAWYGNTLYNIMGIGQITSNNNSTAKHLIARGDANYLDYYENIDLTSAYITDTIIAL